MYSEQCKSCIVEGCPDSCYVKQDYLRDMVKVVRCKDCKWSYEDVFGRICSHGICVDCVVSDDFYCADAERRSE